MSNIKIIITQPGDKNFHLFDQVISSIYPKGHLKFQFSEKVDTRYLKACLVAVENGGRLVGRASCYLNPFHHIAEKQAACIGHFECIEDLDIAKALVHTASKILVPLGAHFLIGPMNGSTWNNYRWAEVNQSERLFFMEPIHMPYYPKLFKAIGFNTFQSYLSNKKDVTQIAINENLSDTLKGFQDKGLNIRCLNPDDLSTDLANIGAFSIEAFQNNECYSPIAVKEFVKKYEPVSSIFDPRLILIAENAQRKIQGLSFSLPDFLDPSKKTAILKTIARKKDSPFKGLGQVLQYLTVEKIRNAGYTHLIHALMAVTNSSAKISNAYQHVQPLRNYHLYYSKIV